MTNSHLLPWKELILSQIFTYLMIGATWLLSSLVFGRIMGVIYTEYILKEGPIIILKGFIFFYIIDLLTPNPVKHFNIFGVLLSEIFEHLFLFLILLVIIVTIPTMWIWSIILYVHIAFGVILGRVKNIKDWYKIVLMSFLFVMSFLIEDFVLYLYNYGVSFTVSLIGFLIIPFMIYILIKRCLKRKKE